MEHSPYDTDSIVHDALNHYVPSGTHIDDDTSTDFSEYVQPDSHPFLPQEDPPSLGLAPPRQEHRPPLAGSSSSGSGVGEFWDASRLDGIETYEDLVGRRDEILALLVQQGDIPHLQKVSADAVEASLVGKQPSWVKLLRRSLSLYSASCAKLGLPVHPICAPKVALYLSRLDEYVASDDLPEPASPIVTPSTPLATAQELHHQPPDLAVSPSSPSSPSLDPTLASTAASTSAGPYDAKPARVGKRGVKKGRKVLKRKTLEQYVNRLTAIRTPTLDIWRARCGSETETSAGLGMSPVVRDICRRAEGESAMDVKKRGRQAKGTQSRPVKRQKKECLDLAPADLQVDLDPVLRSLSPPPLSSLPAVPPPPIIDTPAPAPELGPSHADLAAAVDAVHRHFVVSSGGSSFAVSSPAYPDYRDLHALLPPPPPSAFTLSPDAYKEAEAFVRSLQENAQFDAGEGNLNQQMLGDIARSVQAAQTSTIPDYRAYSADGEGVGEADDADDAEGEGEIEIDPALS